MKNKDYVSQPKRKATKNNKVPERKPFPVIKFTIISVLIAAFTYFLIFLSQESTDDNDISEPDTITTTEESQTLPPPPADEQWQFINELKNKQVEVGTEELKDIGPFVLRCTTVRSQQRAEALKAKIAFIGYESKVKEYQGTSGVWYRVDLGPYNRKRDAEKARHDMKRNNINGCKILLWR